MADMSIDRELAIALPFFMLGTGVSLGFVDPMILRFVDLGSVWFDLAGEIEFTLARIISAAALIGVLVNRDAGIRDTGGIDVYLVYTTMGLILAPPFFPVLESTLAGGSAAFVAFLIQNYGFLAISYLN